MLTNKDMREAARIVREDIQFTGATGREQNRLEILASDLERAADATQGHPTIETLHFEMAVSNDRQMAFRRTAIVYAAKMHAPEPETSDVDAADALRDFFRDELPGIVLDTVRRPVRDEGLSKGEWEGAELFVREMVGLSIAGVDWLEVARDTDTTRCDELLRAHGAAANKIDKVTREKVIEPNAYDVALELGYPKTADIVYDELYALSRVGVLSARYVAGTSGHLFFVPVSRED